MNSESSKIKIDGLFVGAVHSVWAATKTSFFMALLSTITVISQVTFQELIGRFFGMLLMLVLFGGFISFAVALIVGIPVTIILIKSGLDDELISAVIGLLIVAFYYLILGDLHSYVIMFCIYAFFCAGAFMKGYKKSCL